MDPDDLVGGMASEQRWCSFRGIVGRRSPQSRVTGTDSATRRDPHRQFADAAGSSSVSKKPAPSQGPAYVSGVQEHLGVATYPPVELVVGVGESSRGTSWKTMNDGAARPLIHSTGSPSVKPKVSCHRRY